MGIFPGLEVFSVPTKFVASRGVTAGKTFHAGGRNGRTGIEAFGASSRSNGLACRPISSAAAVTCPTGSAVPATSRFAGSGRAGTECQYASGCPRRRRTDGASRSSSDTGACRQPAAAGRHHPEEGRAGTKGNRQEAGSKETGRFAPAGCSRCRDAAPDEHRDADLGANARHPHDLSAR